MLALFIYLFVAFVPQSQQSLVSGQQLIVNNQQVETESGTFHPTCS